MQHRNITERERIAAPFYRAKPDSGEEVGFRLIISGYWGVGNGDGSVLEVSADEESETEGVPE